MPATAKKEVAEETFPKYAECIGLSGRQGFRLELAWNVSDQGSRVAGRAKCTNTGAAREFDLDLQRSNPCSIPLDFEFPAANSITVTLRLAHDYKKGMIVFGYELPVALDKLEIKPLGEWTPGSRPVPSPDTPAEPGEVEYGIAPPPGSSDLFPFVWLQPPSAAERHDIALGFVSYSGYAGLPLYQTLLAAGSADAKRQGAQAFRATAGFVGSLDALGPTVANVPVMRANMLSEEGEIPLDQQNAWVHVWLGLPDDTSLADYLRSQPWLDSLQSIWQTLYTLALVGQPGDASLAEQLVDTLRGAYYMESLVDELELLKTQAARHAVLNCSPAVPDAVAAQPPQPALSGRGANGSQWQVLGVGRISMARQHPLGYVLGELADVVNVMPRERQMTLEREIEGEVRRREASEDVLQENELGWQQSLGNELADSLAEVMSAEGVVRNMTDVKPTYENLNLSLSGSWAGSGGGAAWASNNRSQVVQGLVEQAAERLGKRVNRRRGKEWQRFRERLQSQVIDNSQHDRLVGVYRWVDQVVRVCLEQQGKRLVLSFQIATPAAPWLEQIATPAGAPLAKPVPLPVPAAGQPAYTVVTPDNYQALGLQYGLFDLPAPPPASLACAVKFDQGSPKSVLQLEIPDGYKIQGGNYAALADAGFDLVCMLGDTPLPPIKPADASPLSVTIPACTSSSADPAVVAPPAQPRGTVVGAALPAALQGGTGMLPITVISAAPSYAVSIAATCVPVDAAAGAALLAQWQARLYERLYAAWHEANGNYEKELARRIDFAAAGRMAEIQRSTLQQSCLALLTQVSVTGTPARSLADLFAWQQMTWKYQPWPVGSADPWPEAIPGEAEVPGNPEQFRHFLRAPSASVLLPVAPGWESWVLFYLQFQQYWVGGPASVPVTAGTIAVLEEVQALLAEVPGEQPLAWSMRLPTTLLYLQEDSSLPIMLNSNVQEGR